MILYKKDVIDKLSEKTGLYKKDIKAMLVALNELVYEERIYCVVVIKSMQPDKCCLLPEIINSALASATKQ